MVVKYPTQMQFWLHLQSFKKIFINFVGVLQKNILHAHQFHENSTKLWNNKKLNNNCKELLMKNNFNKCFWSSLS